MRGDGRARHGVGAVGAVRPRLKPYAAEGFPEPINSQGSRIRLYDGEQVDAYLLGKPVPPLPGPEGEDDGDLLDRRECAALLGVAPNSWAIYKRDPVLTEAKGEAGGVGHGPRHAVKAFQAARPGRDAAATRGGRPTRTGTSSRATRFPRSPPSCSTPTPPSAPPRSLSGSVSTATPHSRP
ncbi:hypothetical protein [Streptomyces rubiginosohelvolus]|uniref:hypothetical protein n=1 Tax=Streptomyces rubiginosohelvolus TaxID=67362 RepID=UPI0035D579D8